jgi:hypothetical protein
MRWLAVLSKAQNWRLVLLLLKHVSVHYYAVEYQPGACSLAWLHILCACVRCAQAGHSDMHRTIRLVPAFDGISSPSSL